MAMVPAIMVFGIMVWFATRSESDATVTDPQAGMPDHIIELCYEIEGYAYQVYEIKRPDGTSHAEGGDKYFYIGTSTDMSSALEGSTGPSFYNTKQKAINALTSMYEAENDPNAPTRGDTTVSGGTEYESTSETLEDGTKITKSKPKKADLSKEQDKTVVAEGREESAMLEDFDVELYDGDGSLVDSYNVQDRAGTVLPPTELGGSR